MFLVLVVKIDEWEEDDSPVDETESSLTAALREALEDMVDDNAKEWVYLNLPKINIEELHDSLH